jgi:hypothetical protein
MKLVSLLLLPVMLAAGCSGPTAPSDNLERAALEASRDGSLANYYNEGRGTAGVEAAGRVTARYYWVAKYAATPQQREVATVRARAAVQKMAKRHVKPKSRYIAVPTKRDARAKTATNVMIFDTQSEQIVSNDVYDLNARPPTNQVIRFETYSASFVSAGQ